MMNPKIKYNEVTETELTPLETILLSVACDNSERVAIIANAIQRQIRPFIGQFFDSQYFTKAIRKEDTDRMKALIGLVEKQ